MDLNEMRARYEREEGYSHLNATARVCQDVILSKLAVSSMHDRVTVKGRGSLLFSFMNSTSLRAFSRCRRHLRGLAEAAGQWGSCATGAALTFGAGLSGGYPPYRLRRKIEKKYGHAVPREWSGIAVAWAVAISGLHRSRSIRSRHRSRGDRGLPDGNRPEPVSPRRWFPYGNRRQHPQARVP